MANDSQIGITLTANSTGVEQALEKLGRGLDKTIDKLNKIEKASADSSKAVAGGMEQAAGSALKFVGAITGVGSVVGGVLAIANQLRREYDNLVSRQKDAASAQLGFEGQLAEAVRNAAGLLTGKEMRKQTMSIASDVSADPSSVAAALSSTLSAVGPMNKAEAEQAFAATRAAMRFAPEMGRTDIAALAGTAVDVAKRTGTTPEQAIGFMQNIGGIARVPSLQNLSSNVMPAVMGTTQFGGTIQESGALISAITQGMADTEGRVSGTAGLALAEQLRERLPGLGTTKDRIAAIASDPKMYKAFFQGGRFGNKKFEPASFEKKALPSIEQILTGGSMLNRAFTEGIDKIGDVRGGGQKTYDELLREVNSVTGAGRVQRSFSTATTEQQLLDTVGGQTSITREGLKAFLKAAGQSQLGQDVDSLLFEGKTLSGGMPVDIASATLKRKAGQLRSPAPIGYAGGGGAGGSFQPIATPGELATAAAFERLAKALDVLSSDIKKNTDATDKNTKQEGPKAQVPIKVPSAALGRP